MTSVESPRVPDPKSGSDENSAAVAILRRLDGPIRKSLRASELTAVQHALPKTSLSHAILHENPSHARHLNLHMSQLQRRRLQVAASQENSRKAFIDHQHRKHRTWKSQDETKAAAMNFPVLKPQNNGLNNGGNAKNNGFNNGNNSGGGVLSNSQNNGGNGENNGQNNGNNQNNQNHLSATEQRDVMYKSPRYMLPNDVDPTDGTPRLMPYMSVRRERTEFLSYQQKTYMLRLPTVIVSDGKKMARYDDYCGKTMLDLGKPAQDDRFQKLANSLSASAAHESVVTARDFASAREYTSAASRDFQASASRDKQHTSRDNNNNQSHASQQHNHLVTQQQQQQPRQGSNLPPMSSGTTTTAATVNAKAPQPPASSSAAPGDAASNALRDHTPPGAAPPPQGLQRERAHTNLARAKTKGDLKGQSVDDLRHKYGHLKSSYDNKDKDASDSGTLSRKVQPKAQSDKR